MIETWRTDHAASLGELRYTIYQVKSSPLTLAGFLLTAATVLIAIFGPFIVQDSAFRLDVQSALEPPSFVHLFGTDDLGRDIFSRIVFGFRVSLVIGLVVVCIAVCTGLILGVPAGYLGGIFGETIMRITDIFLAFPSTALAIAIAAALGRNLTNAVLALAITWWPWYTRLVNGQVLSLRETGYVEAAKAVGASTPRILLTHILPNCIAPVIVNASMDFGWAILAAAGLSFLGVGAQPPEPEWGLMISQGSQYMFTHWWVAAFPGLAIAVTVLGWNLLGDGLRDILDPRLRRR